MAAGSIGVLQSTTPDRKMQTFSNVVGANTVEAEAVTLVDSSGAEKTSFAGTVADGSNAVEGGTTDAAVVTDANGTLSGKLRGLIKLFVDQITVKIASSQSIAVTQGTASNLKTAATLDAETTKVIGTVNISASQTVTANNTVATTVVSTALEASHVLKSSSGSLVSLSWLNSKTSAQYLLIMNSTTVPSDGAVTLLYPPIYMPPTSNGMLEFKNPLVASTGISVSNSSTGTFTKTIGSADCVFCSQVI